MNEHSDHSAAFSCPVCDCLHTRLVAGPDEMDGECLACGARWKQNRDGTSHWDVRLSPLNS